MGTCLMIIVDFISVLVWFSFPGKVLTFKNNKKWLTILMLSLNFIEVTMARLDPAINSNPIKTLVYFSQYAIYIIFAYKERPPKILCKSE